VQACPSGCEHSLSISGTEHVAAIISVQKIEDGAVYLTLRVKRFGSAPHIKHLADEMADAALLRYTYTPGQTLQIPVSGGGEVGFEGKIVPSGDTIPDWVNIPVQPDENQIGVLNGLFIRDGQVIGEMIGSGSAWGRDSDSNTGFYAYMPGHGLVAVALKEFNGAIQGTANYGRIQFSENGVKYILASGSAITGGAQPRKVWVLYRADYLPSQHDPQGNDSSAQFGTGASMVKILEKMGAM
ncbi:MAG: hypothetical protein WB997_07990, partial [Candidatus Acidiferrales bacterium]